MKINNRKELQNISVNRFADIDYNDFVKIYREHTRKPYCFLATDPTLPASDPLRFRKNLLPSYKKCQYLISLKSLTTKLKQIKLNMIQTDIAAKLSAHPSGYLRKNEYLTVQDLGYKPKVVEQVKLDYSPLGKVFTKVLTEDDKKEGLSKRLKNIEDKN